MDNFQFTPSIMEVFKDENDKRGDSSDATNAAPSELKPRRDIMAAKFKAGIVPDLSKVPYQPKPFFFYGTLMDSLQLQQVLRLQEPPVLMPARVIHRKIMLWGQYPALVREGNHSYVDGMAYVVKTVEQQKMLESYETHAYTVSGIRITIDGQDGSGIIFEWSDHQEEQLEEGTWSLEEWKKGLEEEMASHFRPVHD